MIYRLDLPERWGSFWVACFVSGCLCPKCVTALKTYVGPISRRLSTRAGPRGSGDSVTKPLPTSLAKHTSTKLTPSCVDYSIMKERI